MMPYLGGTFFQNGEIPGRDMSEVPHDFIMEGMALFSDLPEGEKAKVHFVISPKGAFWEQLYKPSVVGK